MLTQTQKTYKEAWDMLQQYRSANLNRVFEIALTRHHTITIIGKEPDGGFNFGDFWLHWPFEGHWVYPCKCGNYGHPDLVCTCKPATRRAHWRSKKWMEATRSDIIIEWPIRPMLNWEPEPFKKMWARVEQAKHLLSLDNLYPPTRNAQDFLNKITDKGIILPAQRETLLLLARTIACLDNRHDLDMIHLAEAVQYKNNRGLK